MEVTDDIFGSISYTKGSDCLALGRHYFNEKNFKKAIEWLLEAERLSSYFKFGAQLNSTVFEEPVNPADVFEMLSYSSFMVQVLLLYS